MIVESMTRLKEAESVAYSRQCNASGMPYSSVMRWRSRIEGGREPVEAPGPKKVDPLDIACVYARINELKHGRKRTAGSSALYEELNSGVSRRALQGLLTEVRQEKNRERVDALCRIQWCMPGLVWAVDDTEYNDKLLDQKIYLHSIRDLGSRYTFEPLVGLSLAKGEAVAKNLDTLFKQYGAPLFLKRDNGGNLNHGAVDAVLSEHMVLPINSPPYYPPYNGGIEKTQSEVKAALGELTFGSVKELQLGSRLIAHDLNHKKRPCLSRQTPCSALFSDANRTRMFTKRRRKEVYDQIAQRAAYVLEVATDICAVDTAWRLAVETWLLENDMITVSRKRKCYPFSDEKSTHN